MLGAYMLPKVHFVFDDGVAYSAFIILGGTVDRHVMNFQRRFTQVGGVAEWAQVTAVRQENRWRNICKHIILFHAWHSFSPHFLHP